MRKIDIWTVIMAVIVLLILAVLPAQASVGAQCCYTPAPEPTVGEARATVTRRGDAILTVPTSRQLVRLAVTS